MLDARMAPHMTWALWVAPTKDGGFCEIRINSQFASEGHSPDGCYPPDVRPDDRLNLGVCLCGVMAGNGPGVAPDGEILAPPVVLEGTTTQERAASLRLRFEDGESQSIPLVWVGEPVDTAFFLYSVPERHWQKGHLPTTLTMLSANGDELDTRDVHGVTTKGSFTP